MKPWLKEEFIKRLKEEIPNLLFENNPEPEQRAYQVHKIIDKIAEEVFK